MVVGVKLKLLVQAVVKVVLLLEAIESLDFLLDDRLVVLDVLQHMKDEALY